MESDPVFVLGLEGEREGGREGVLEFEE